MKVKIYLRVAQGSGRGGAKVDASSKPNYKPIFTKNYRGETFFPTVAFAVNFEIPDELFKSAERTIADVVVGLKKAGVAAEVAIPDKIKK